MAEDRIDSIVGAKAYKQLDDLTAKLEMSQQALVDNIEAAIKLNNVLGNSKSMSDLEKSNVNATKAVEALNKAQTENQLLLIKLDNERQKVATREDARINKEIANAQKRSKIITDQSRLYTQLSNTLEKLRKDAQDVGAQFGTSSVQFQRAADRVTKLDARLKDIDKQLGKSQRFVGEYERAGGRTFNGLANSINQISRELPAFTFSVQTGFLALSNNLPILADEIKNTKLQIEALRAEGKEVPGLFKQIASSFFSWMTFLSIGITILTVYGKEIGNFITALFKGTKALDAFVESQRKLREAYKEGNKDAGSQITTLKTLYDAATNVALGDETRLKAIKALKEQFPSTFKNLSDEAIKTGELSGEVAKLTEEIIKQSRARAINNKLGDLESQILDDEILRQRTLNANANAFRNARGFIQTTIGAGGVAGTSGTGRQVSAEEQRAEIARTSKAQIAAIDARIAARKKEQQFLQSFTDPKSQVDAITGDPKEGGKTAESISLQRLKLQQTILEGHKAINKAFVDDDTQSLDLRLKAYDDYEKNVTDLIENSRQQKLQQEDLTAIQIETINKESQNELTNQYIEGSNEREKIRKDVFDKELKELEDAYKKQIDAAKKADAALLDRLNATSEQRQEALQNDADAELNVLAYAYSEGEIKAQEYAQKRIDIQRALSVAIINEEIANIQTIIDLQKKNGLDAADQEKKLAELKQRLSKETTATQIANLEQLAEREAELIEKRRELQQEFGNFAIAIVNGAFERSQRQLQDEADQIDIRKQRDIDAVDRSIATEQDKANRIAIIEAKAQGQKEQIARRQRQLEIEQAKFDRAAAIAGIILNTARGVTSALALFPPNIPLSILIGAIGAAQLATAVAAPLPKFKDGGTMEYTGIAEYGHGTELRIDPDGTMSLTKSTPEIGVVQKGTEFISNADLVKMLAKPDPIQWAGGMALDVRELVETTKESGKRIEKAIGGLRQRNGGTNYYSTAKGREYLKRNF